MANGVIATRYAQGLYQLCAEDGCINDVAALALIIHDLLREEPRFNAIISHPEISRKEKMDLLETALAGGPPEDELKDIPRAAHNMLGFCHVALSKGHGRSLNAFLARFVALVNEGRGVTNAYVTTAVPLGKKKIAAVAAALSRKLGKRVEVEPVVDPGLIGGMRVCVDGKMLDQTLLRQMAELKHRLLKP